MAISSIYKSPAGEKAVMDLYDDLLARWPVSHQTKSIHTSHGKTFVIMSGHESSPPLILLHGAGSNSLMWAGDVVEYSHYYRVVAVDLPGEPGKSEAKRLAWQSPAYAEWLGDVLDRLKIERTHLIGISQGAWLALKFGILNPDRVNKMVLLTPGGIVPDKFLFVLQAVTLSMLGNWGNRRIHHMLLAGQTISPEFEDAMVLIMTHFKPRMGILPIFSDAELQGLKMPVFLLMGGKDVLRDAVRIRSRMQSLVPDLCAAIIPEGGHALLYTPKYVLPFLQNGIS